MKVNEFDLVKRKCLTEMYKYVYSDKTKVAYF